MNNIIFLNFAILFFVVNGCRNKADKQQFFSEPYRPQYHFTPEKNWMNDPNGTVFYAGIYHLYYQYNPYGKEWGNMHWGHATSTDMIHWKHQPIAIKEEDSIMIFSGSVVVDKQNVSGLGKDHSPPLLAFYTGCDRSGWQQTIRMAYSTDSGYTFNKYKNNPLIDLNAKKLSDRKCFFMIKAINGSCTKPTGKTAAASCSMGLKTCLTGNI